jgi:hypothetical protein
MNWNQEKANEFKQVQIRLEYFGVKLIDKKEIIYDKSIAGLILNCHEDYIVFLPNSDDEPKKIYYNQIKNISLI